MTRVHGAMVLVAGIVVAACGNNGFKPSTVGASNDVVPIDVPLLNDQPWNDIVGNSWDYLRRESAFDSDVVFDPSAPVSPPSVIRLAYTPDMPRDTEPGVHWMPLPQLREIYAEWWIKLSDNWTTSPIGASKMTFFWPAEGEGQAFTHLGGSAGSHHVQINTEWAPYGQHFWEPNVSTTRIVYGRWHHVAVYAKWSSRQGLPDGIFQWWVDGALNGDHRNVHFPRCCFEQFEFAPTRQFPPDKVEYMFIDHTSVRGR